MKLGRVAIAAALLLAAIPLVMVQSAEKWPTPFIPNKAGESVQFAQQYWLDNPEDWRGRAVEHEAFNDYLNISASLCAETSTVVVDENGIFMSTRPDFPKPGYNVVLLAQCGLKGYGAWLRYDDAQYLDLAIKHADKLIEIMDDTGALRYDFQWKYYVTEQYIPSGWTSAMGQGQTLSLFARLHHATSEQRYLDAGVKVLEYLLTSTASGGVRTDLSDLDPSLSDYVWFEEIVSKPNDNYILNGFMFALFGLYDWAQVPASTAAKQDLAQHYFDEGIRSLEKVLPYYDFGGMTVYDLTHFTFNNRDNLFVSAGYHVVHVYELYALHSITGSPVLKEWMDKWAGYLEALASAAE